MAYHHVSTPWMEHPRSKQKLSIKAKRDTKLLAQVIVALVRSSPTAIDQQWRTAHSAGEENGQGNGERVSKVHVMVTEPSVSSPPSSTSGEFVGDSPVATHPENDFRQSNFSRYDCRPRMRVSQFNPVSLSTRHALTPIRPHMLTLLGSSSKKRKSRILKPVASVKLRK